MHAKRLSRPMPRRAGCPTQRSSQHCRRARPPRCLTLPHMTWALRRTPSGRPVHPSQPTTLRKLGPRNANGSGDTSLPLSANSFSTINNAGAPSAGTPSTTDERRVGNARARSVHSRYTRCRVCIAAGTHVHVRFRQGPRAVAGYSPSRGKVCKICCRCMTCRGTNSAMVSPTTSTDRPTLSRIRCTSTLVSPSGSAPRPNTISLLSTVSTSK